LPPASPPPPAPEPADLDSWLFSKDGRRLVDSQKRPVELKNNPKAKNPPLQKLIEFIKANQVNYRTYETGKFVCTEFAVQLHNDAEAAGLRSGLVAIRFQQGLGHALNVFQTTDKGLVYVDCTGTTETKADRSLYDTIAYVQVGKPYGRLPLEIGAFDPNHYERYPYVMGLWNQAMQEELKLDQERHKLSVQREQLKSNTARFRDGVRQNPEAYYSPAGEAQAAELLRQEAELEKKRQQVFARYEKLVAQFKRLRCRYNHNPSPVKSLDTWW
jgi:hypothetical protein